MPAPTFERALSRFEPIFARFVPVWRVASRTNFRLAFSALAWHPFVLAPVTTIALLLERDQCHEDIIPENNILSIDISLDNI